MQQQGINPDDYARYFPMMASNDVPIINSLPNLTFILDLDTLKSAEENWSGLKSMYSAIDVEKQNEATGRDIIIAMTKAMEHFDSLFCGYARECRTANQILQPYSQLKEARKTIVELAHRYTDGVPAYVAYRHYGRFLLDAEGLRGYQRRELLTQPGVS